MVQISHCETAIIGGLSTIGNRIFAAGNTLFNNNVRPQVNFINMLAHGFFSREDYLTLNFFSPTCVLKFHSKIKFVIKFSVSKATHKMLLKLTPRLDSGLGCQLIMLAKTEKCRKYSLATSLPKHFNRNKDFCLTIWKIFQI